MMNIVDKYIAENEEKSFILEQYELGFKQKEIENFMIEEFKPYLKSKSILRAQVLAYMPEYIDILINILSDNNAKLLFEKCIEVYWKAKDKDLVKCYNSYKYWQEDVLKATSKLVTLITLDQDRSKMELHEFAEDVFTKIGKIIEACIKPYLKILLYLEHMVNNKKTTKEDINKLALGNIVNQLYDKKNYDGIVIPSPWDLRLNDWRNIPKHDNYTVKDNRIFCIYGRPPYEMEVSLLKIELWKLFLDICEIFSILRLAHSVFFLDNIEEIQPYWDNKQLRKESALLDLISLYGMHGLSVIEYSIGKNHVEFQLKDKITRNANLRLNDLIFLIRPVWYKTRKRFINLEYVDFYNNSIFKITTDTSIREDIFSLGVDEDLITIENIKQCMNLTDFRKSNNFEFSP